MCAAPAGGAGSRVHRAPPSLVLTSSPRPSAQPWLAETKLTSCTSIGPVPRALGDAAVGRLGAAAAAWLAVTDADRAADHWVVDDWVVDAPVLDAGTEPGPDDPQPATTMSAASAATVTTKRLFMSSKTPNSAARLGSGP